jgi:signal transduction histidine kinase
MKVLMVGATGKYASHVIPELKQRGVTIRALVRDKDKIDPARQQGADEAVVGDLNDPASLGAAASEMEGVFHLTSSSTQRSRVGRGDGGGGESIRSAEICLLWGHFFNTRKQPLQQVFLHLIDNAIRHHPSKVGRVEISALDLEDRYEFTIADDGNGIDPQFHDRIYTIFQTLTARDLQENVGAGLAIVKKIVAAEGGTIELNSAVGRGATFKFTWLKQPIVS